MKKEYIVTGKSLEAAQAQAYAQYGHEGEISIRVIKEAKKGFLGIGSSDAEIKVTVVTDEDNSSFDSILKDVKRMNNSSAPKKEHRQEYRNNQSQDIAKPEAKAEKPVKQPVTVAPAETPVKKSKHRHKHKKKNPSQMNAAPEQVQKKMDNVSERKPLLRDEEPMVVTEEEIDCAFQYAQTLVASMEIGAHVECETDENGKRLPRLNVVGDETGILIGHHGETLDAIQYLINLSVNRKMGEGKEFVKVSVDVENYRAKREATLRALARRMAEKCIKYKKNFVLEPMNPYERRIIHSEIQNMENVSTHSVGYDENRKIVVTYEGADKVVDFKRNNRHNSFNRTDRKENTERDGEQSKMMAEEAKEALRQYAAEKAMQPKPEKMTFEDFAAADSADIPMSILTEKKKSE